MQKGFAVPTLILVILVLLFAPVAVVSYKYHQNTSNVKGAYAVSDFKKSGVAVNVKTSSSNWTLVVYGCETLEMCLESIESGKRVKTIGGNLSQSLFLEAINYPYIKYFVKDAQNQRYMSQDLVNLGDAQIKTFLDNNVELDTVIVPTSAISNTKYKSNTFLGN